MKFATSVFSTFLLAASADAQGILVDQSNDQTPWWSLTPWNLKVGEPVGQEFVPALSGLDFVDARFSEREGSASSLTIQVLIREGSITGPVVGSSSQVTFFGNVIQRFDFPSTVPLTPGQTYVMHFFHETPTDYSIAADPTMSYFSGQAIRSGTPLDGYDLWFREGLVVVPEPSCVVLCLLGGILWTLRLRRRP